MVTLYLVYYLLTQPYTMQYMKIQSFTDRESCMEIKEARLALKPKDHVTAKLVCIKD
jgi:hypothetical protein